MCDQLQCRGAVINTCSQFPQESAEIHSSVSGQKMSLRDTVAVRQMQVSHSRSEQTDIISGIPMLYERNNDIAHALNKGRIEFLQDLQQFLCTGAEVRFHRSERFQKEGMTQSFRFRRELPQAF